VPPFFGPFQFGGEMVLAAKNNLVVDVIEDFVQIPSELLNTGQMDVSHHEFWTKKSRQL